MLLPGGVDLDPRTFGEPPHPKLGNTDAAGRGGADPRAVGARDGKPLFGLCRGLQVINVALGGSLYRTSRPSGRRAIKHDYFPTAGFARDYLAHDVELTAGTRLARVLGRRGFWSTACITRVSGLARVWSPPPAPPTA